jgi:hypothetical protein
MMASPRRLFRGSILGAACVLVFASLATAGEIEVIFTEVPGHPTAIVPGAVDLNGDPIVVEFKAIEDMVLSADGTQWILKGRNHGGSDIETMLLLGSGISGSVFAQEGQPVAGGVAPEVYDFFDGSAGFNASGHYVFGARARGGDTTVKEKLIKYDGSYTIVVQESDPAFNLQDLPPDPTGDELFGNSLNSAHILDNGDIGFVAVTIQNIHSTRRPAIFYNDQAFAQSGVTAVDGSVWDSFDSDDFWTTPDGAHWIAQGDDENIDTNVDDILAYDGAVVLRENSVIPSTSVTVVGIFNAKLLANGDWYARGDDPLDNDWAVRNGELLAQSGDPIFPGSTESWTDVFLTFAGNRDGDWILIGSTDNPDPAVDTVCVLNGQEVVLREGDPVDLDGNGVFDDDAFIGRGTNTQSAFNPNDAFLTDDDILYFIAPLHNAAGEDLGEFGTGGDAFMRVRMPQPCSSGNVAAELGSLENVLLVNGTSGGVGRCVSIDAGSPITVSLDAASAGPNPARYVAWIWLGYGENPTDLNAAGSAVGCTVNPTPRNGGLVPQPAYCIPGVGIPGIACGDSRVKIVADHAPWSVTKQNGLAQPRTFTIQGLLEDDSTLHPKGFSVTNAVTVINE